MKKIYFVGTPTKGKGIEDFNLIAKQIIDAEFYWFCFEVNKSLKKKYHKIIFITDLVKEKLQYFIKKEMDLMVCCSHFEGFCLPIAEAMLLEKPVISYRLPEIESVYFDNIEYVECFDLNEYIDKLKEFILKNNYNKDKEKARNFIINNYSPEIVSQRLLKILL